MDLNEAKEQLKMVRLCMGNQRKAYTSHRNEVLDADYASINKNIQINIAKLDDAIHTAEIENEGDCDVR